MLDAIEPSHASLSAPGYGGRSPPYKVRKFRECGSAFPPLRRGGQGGGPVSCRVHEGGVLGAIDEVDGRARPRRPVWCVVSERRYGRTANTRRCRRFAAADPPLTPPSQGGEVFCHPPCASAKKTPPLAIDFSISSTPTLPAPHPALAHRATRSKSILNRSFSSIEGSNRPWPAMDADVMVGKSRPACHVFDPGHVTGNTIRGRVDGTGGRGGARLAPPGPAAMSRRGGARLRCGSSDSWFHIEGSTSREVGEDRGRSCSRSVPCWR